VFSLWKHGRGTFNQAPRGAATADDVDTENMIPDNGSLQSFLHVTKNQSRSLLE